jgi:predicted ATPase
MNTFESIRIQGFRRLSDVTLNLKPLNVVIGANGGGKTSLLDVFSLLANSASGRLNEALSDLGGISGNLTNLTALNGYGGGSGSGAGKGDGTGYGGGSGSGHGDKAKFVAFDLAMPVSGQQPLQYHISLTPQGVSYEILDETLSQQRGQPQPFKHIDARRANVMYFDRQTNGLVPPAWNYTHSESALSQVPKMFQYADDFRKRLASSTHYHVLDVSRRAPIRLPQQLRDARLPGHDGEDLVSCLYSLRETDPERFERVEAALRAGFPGFERLNFPPVAASSVSLTWKDKTSTTPFYMHQLSEGTLRFLWLATLLQSPGLTEVTLIDEPEVSLHPELLALLVGLLREASKRTQLIVATHADRLVRFLNPDEVLAIDVNDGGASEIRRADGLGLEQWLKDYSLDEIWQMGRMGGRL